MAKGTFRSNSRRPQAPTYTQRTLQHDREYGFYWYAWLWKAFRPFLILIISLVIVLGIVSTGWSYVYNHFFMPVDPKDTSVREFVIEQNSLISTIGDNLYEQGFIKNTGVFKYVVQFQELTNKIQFGSYPLSSSMDINQIIATLAQGSAPNEITITIIPGWTVDDIANYLLKQQAIKSVDEFQSLCRDAETFRLDSYSLQDAIDSNRLAGRRYALEGYLSPDTYRIYRSAKPDSIVKTLLHQFDTVRDRVFTEGPQDVITVDEQGNRLDDEGNIMTEDPEVYETTLTKEQTLVLASIIEKEAGKRDDFKKVSAVFHNRLQQDIRLESDATVAYGIGVKRLVLTSDELNTPNGYNTYLNDGLPIGPICNPSPWAIEAALYPNMDFIYDGYLFFCATDPAKGDLYFSKTKEEHDAAVAQYRPLWIEHDRKQAGVQ